MGWEILPDNISDPMIFYRLFLALLLRNSLAQRSSGRLRGCEFLQYWRAAPALCELLRNSRKTEHRRLWKFTEFLVRLGAAGPFALLSLQLAFGAGPFLAKPYLQLGRMPANPTHLELLWHTADVDATWNVEYKIAESSSWQPATKPTFRQIVVPTIDAHRVYKVELTKLAPGKAFEYRVTEGGEVI